MESEEKEEDVAFIHWDKRQQVRKTTIEEFLRNKMKINASLRYGKRLGNSVMVEAVDVEIRFADNDALLYVCSLPIENLA